MSGISFTQIDANQRAPLYYNEFDGSRNANFAFQQKTLLVGQSINAVAETQVLVTSTDQAKSLFGAGSMLAIMYEAYRLNDSQGEVWVFPYDDTVNAGTQATGTVTVTGTATANGTIFLYIAGKLVRVGVASGDTATVVGDSIVTAVSANTDLPVSAVNAVGVVTLTAKNEGSLSNKIDVQVNFNGSLGNEVTPAGLTVVIVAMATGATDPDVATVIAAIGIEEFDFIVSPYHDTTNLDAWDTELTSRWDAQEQIYGHLFYAKEDTVSGLNTFGDARNSRYATDLGYFDSPSWDIFVGAASAGAIAKSLRIDPARPLQTLEIKGMVQAPAASRFTNTELNTLYFSGITPIKYTGGAARMDRVITNYQLNAFGQPDSTYLDITTQFTLAFIGRFYRNLVESKWPRVKLAADGNHFSAGQAIVTPKLVRAELIEAYKELIFVGICEDLDGFKTNLIVQVNPGDPNRLDVSMSPNLVNGLVVFANRISFII